ncbi:MAG: hypothetical protein JRG82_14355 [Deltaproteobacteria bacterium]|nr:hypothetical protein [Deltaproteobacteria bacterium]
MKASTLLAAFVCASLTTGCLFTARHELPANAVFGKFPEHSAAGERPFEDSGMKNWALAGFVPWTGWGSQRMLEEHDPGSGLRIENLAIETRFGTWDTIIWVFPGFFYGYYLWAPRTVEVSGSVVHGQANGR